MFWFHEKIGLAETRRKRAHFGGTFIFDIKDGSYACRDHSLPYARAIITHGLYTFHPLLEVHLCTVTFGLMYC